MLLIFTKKKQCTLQVITSVLFQTYLTLVVLLDHMFNIAVVIPFLTVPVARTILPTGTHSQIYLRCLHDLKNNNNKKKLRTTKQVCYSRGYPEI